MTIKRQDAEFGCSRKIVPTAPADSAAYDSTAEKLGCSRFTLREWCIQTERVSLKR